MKLSTLSTKYKRLKATIMAYELNNAQAVKFGDYTPALLERIKRDTRFNERPRGPLGLFLNQKYYISIGNQLELSTKCIRRYVRNAFR